MSEHAVQIIALSLVAIGVIATVLYCIKDDDVGQPAPTELSPAPRGEPMPRTGFPKPHFNPPPAKPSELPKPRTRYGDESRAPVVPWQPTPGTSAPEPTAAPTATATPPAQPQVADRPAPRRPRINLDDLAPVPKPKPPPKRPRRPKEEEHEEPAWPRGLHKPAKSWVNGLPRPTEKSLPFYEHSLRAAYACAWVDQSTDRSELNCIRSWTHFVKTGVGKNAELATRIDAAAQAALGAGRISTAAALEHSREVSRHGSQTACRSVGNLCLAVVTADKILAPGEISLVSGIWRQLDLPLGDLRKSVERMIASDEELSEAVSNAELDDDLGPEEKLGALKRRLYTLNARLQNRRGADLERDQQEIHALVRVIQLYKEMDDHV